MNELEIHRFRTVERDLTAAEQKEIDTWSSRFSPTATGVDYVYEYGSFRKEREEVFIKYFDAMLFADRWNTTQLMFRFPANLVNWEELTAFTNVIELKHLDFRKEGDFVIMDLQLSEEEGYREWMIAENYSLDPILRLREEIINGDYRTLYLAWLVIEEWRHLYEEEGWYEVEGEEDRILPPVPANLKHLHSAHQDLIRMFGLNEHLVSAAATVSFDSLQEPAYQQLIDDLPLDEKNNFLWQLAKGEKRLTLKLRRRLEELSDDNKNLAYGKSLDWEVLKQRAEEEKLAAEKAKKEAERQAHIKKMKELQPQQEKFWKQIPEEFSRQIASSYDRGTDLLVDLKAVAIFENKLAAFEKRKTTVLAPFLKSAALKRRLKEHQLIE